jgi:hypothetical protein
MPSREINAARIRGIGLEQKVELYNKSRVKDVLMSEKAKTAELAMLLCG